MTESTSKTNIGHPERNYEEIWLNPMLAIEHVEKGDEITFRYVQDDGKADTPSPNGDERTVTATITKIVEGGVGGIWLDPDPEAESKKTYKLHLIEGGTVTGTHTYGHRSVRHGLRAKIRIREAPGEASE